MRDYFHPEMEMMLSHLERALSKTGKGKNTLSPDARHDLMRLTEEIMHGPFSMRMMGPEMNDNLHMLRRRIEMAHTNDELREVLRDLRVYMFAAGSFAQTREMENRLHDLEGQMKSVADGAAAQDNGTDDKVITLDSLKDKKLLFTIMPFHEDFQDVWAGGIQRAATGTGLTPVRIDMITKSSEITDEIVTAINLSEIIVVDVTRNNPNVMFEFGFALALKKPHVVISQSTEFLTFDIKNVRTLIYRNSWRGIEELHKELQKFIKGTIGDKAKSK